MLDAVTYNKLMQHIRSVSLHSVGFEKPVLDKDLTTPPGSPSDGDRYIVGVSATGDWDTHDNDYVQYDDVSSSWGFSTPIENTLVFVVDENAFYKYTVAGGWELYVNIDVVTENIITPVMTGYTQDGYTVTDSEHESANYGWKVFDRGSGTAWGTTSGVSDAWVKIQLPEPKIVTKISIDITDYLQWGLYGSTDDSNWDHLVSGANDETNKLLSNRKAYTYYKLALISMDTSTYLAIGFLNLFEEHIALTYFDGSIQQLMFSAEEANRHFLSFNNGNLSKNLTAQSLLKVNDKFLIEEYKVGLEKKIISSETIAKLVGSFKAILDKDLTAPPGSPTEGDVYIVGESATGLWSGKDDDIIMYNSIGWDSFTPSENMLVYVTDESAIYKYTDADGWNLYLKQNDFIIDIQSGAWIEDPTNAPEHEDVEGSNTVMSFDWFDLSTEEFLLAQVKMPPDLDPNGTVYLEVEGRAKTAAASKAVQLCFYHKAVSPGEDPDGGAYTAKKSGNFVPDSTQNELDLVEWDETIDNLGWTANELVLIRLSRCDIEAGPDALIGDYGTAHLRLKIPRGV